MIYDVYIMIFSLLDVKSWASTRLVCKYFYEICHNPSLIGCVLNMENASRTWSDFVFVGETDKENILFLRDFLEGVLARECICLNPFKHKAPPYLCWFLKQDFEKMVDKAPSALKYGDLERNKILDKSHPFHHIRNTIFWIVLGFFIDKRSSLTPCEVETPDDPLFKLRMNILSNMQDKLSLLEVYSFSIKTGLDDSSLQKACFRGNFDAYVLSPERRVEWK